MASDGDFGRRGPDKTPKQFRALIATSPLLKQIGGVALGIAIVVSVGTIGRYGLQQFGKSLDGRFVETARPGDPQAAIDKLSDPDKLLRSVHNACLAFTSRLTLTDAPSSSGLPSASWLAANEEGLLRSGAYVACLATESTHRFCSAAHRQHLVAATGEYFKQLRRVREEWMLQGGSVGHANNVFARGGTLRDADLRSPQGSPSSQADAPMLNAVRKLSDKGLVISSDFAGLSRDARQVVAPAFQNSNSNRRGCS